MGPGGKGESKVDIEANLREMREMVAEVNAAWDAACASDVEPMADSHLYRMAELFEAMDGWLSKGGHAPKDWR
jgi:hypothetical protein